MTCPLKGIMCRGCVLEFDDYTKCLILTAMKEQSNKIVIEYNTAHPGQYFLNIQIIEQKRKEIEALGFELEVKGVFKGYTPMLDKMGLTEKVSKMNEEELVDLMKDVAKNAS